MEPLHGKYHYDYSSLFKKALSNFCYNYLLIVVFLMCGLFGIYSLM